MALTGVFPKDENEKVPTGPLDLIKCNNCDLVQLGHSFDLSQLYGQHYGYRSGLNGSMVRHLNSKVQEILKKIDLVKGDLVIDIGSNDSTTLRAYPDRSLDLIGIDPSAAKFRSYYPSDVRLLVDFFSAKRIQEAVGTKKAKIITSIAMFYDLEDPVGFMKEIAQVLSETGIWVFEQSYLRSMIDSNSYDTICHEHFEYYGLKQIQLMAEKPGLKILDVEFNEVNGGSFSVTAAHKSNTLPQNTRLIQTTIEEEEKTGLFTPQTFLDMMKRVEFYKQSIKEFFAQADSDKKNVLGYGASTKGNVLLQYCGITSAELPCIAEVSEDKFGAFTPGTTIPIVSESTARKMNPDYFFVLPWHFRAGILQREKAFRDAGNHFVFPLPEFSVV